MPPKKVITTKTTKKTVGFVRKGKAYNRRSKSRIRTYAFNRQMESLLALEAPTSGSDWISITDASDPYGHCLVKTFKFNMADLPNPNDFQNLYRQYKLNHAVMKMFPSYSQIAMTHTAVGTTNLIITIWKNTDGTELDGGFRNAKLLEIQAKKQFLMPQNKPLTISMPLHQLRNTYAGQTLGINNPPDYAIKKPSYISTTEMNTPHYGFNVHIRKVDGSAFTSNGPRFLIKEKLYFTCKQVH